MAMIACKECRTQISNKAKACPQCGAPVPKKSNNLVSAIVVLIAVLFIARCVSSGIDNRIAAPPRLDDAACMKSLKCWADRHQINASGPCTRAIEAKLRFDHEWTSGPIFQRFPNVAWKDPENGVFTLFGSALRAQNAFGAMQNADYACVYDPIRAVVVTAVVEGK